MSLKDKVYLIIIALVVALFTFSLLMNYTQTRIIESQNKRVALYYEVNEIQNNIIDLQEQIIDVYETQ
jgi:sensor domain CHASE-containing protein